MAPEGQTAAQSKQSPAQRKESTTGMPRNRSGKELSRAGKGNVRYPCRNLSINTLNIFLPYLQIVPAIGQIETFVTKRKIEYLFPSHRHRQAEPVMERRIGYFIAGKSPSGISQRHMTDLSPPSFNQRHRQALRGGICRL